MASEHPSLNVDNSLPPRFYEMGEYRFQRFVTDLYDYEPEIATSSEYGLRGQSDHGADVIARRHGSDGQEVASCKCYERTSANQIREWSDEFLEHWDEHWSGQDIRRFVLATTATNAASRSIQDQVTRERERFAALGVAYEMWGPVTLVAKVRPHRAIATTYLGPVWAEQICGPAAEPGLATSTRAGLVSAALIGQVAELQARLSAHALEAVERAQEDLRAGRTLAVRSLIEEQRREDNWAQLDGRAQAKLLRLAASLALNDEDVAEAERLSSAADALAPQEEPRLAAHIELERNGPAAALAVLGEVSSLAGRQLRVTLRVMTGDLEGAESDLAKLKDADPDDPETIRMEALVALAGGRPETALNHMRRAEALTPDRNAVRQLGAMVRYACALSPAITPDWYLSPNAFDGAFVREDTASQELLEEALALLDRLVGAEPGVIHHRVWRLAVLASMRGRRDRAREEADDLLVRSDYDPTVIAWCLFRGIDVDLRASEETLIHRYAEGADQNVVRVLGLLLTRHDDPASAAQILRSALDRQQGESREEAEAWIDRLQRGRDGLAGGPSVFAQARQNGDWGPVAARVSDLLSSVPPDPAGLGLAEGVAMEGRFEVLAPHVDAILSFQTATAVRLAAFTAYRAGDAKRALEILEDQGNAFGGALPPDMRRLRADALARTGDVAAALREADAVASSGSTRDRLFRAELMTSTGNVRGAVPAVREALDAGLLRGAQAFQWSRVMRAEEPGLARRLLERAIATELDERLVAAAMHDALGLRLGAEADALMARVHARAMSGADDVRLLTVDELPGLIARHQARAAETEQMYLDGAAPVHLLLAYDPAQFALLHLAPNISADGSMRPWLIRHGARPPFVDYGAAWTEWRVHIDISSLLVAARLELTEAIEAHPEGVWIPADTPLLLLSMETGCRERADATIAERILAANLTPLGLDDAPAVKVFANAAETAGTPHLSLAVLVRALAARGALDADTARHVLEDASANNTDDVPAEGTGDIPADGAALILDAESVRRLASFDALSPVTERFDVRCDGLLLDQALRARSEAAVALDAAETLARLRGHVASGLESGAYRLIARAADSDDEDEEEGLGNTPVTRCLADTISAHGRDGGIAWIDDRMVTGYARTAYMPVAGVSDVLEALRREGRITLARQKSALAALRAAGALFLVPSREEILAELLPAPLQGQRIVETPALAALRRSLAHAILHERNLAIDGNGRDGRPDEVVPIQTTIRLLTNCLKEIWLNDSLSYDHRIALGDWLWLNTRRTHVGRVLPGADPAAAQDNFETIQIAHCLDQAVDIGLLKDQRRQAREEYLHWLWVRAVEPLVAVDPAFVARLAGYLADFYAEMDRAQTGHSPRDRRILHMLLGARVQRLPEWLQGELYRDPRMRAFGTSRERITIKGAHFEADVFWRAVRRALRYGSARLRFHAKGKGRSRLIRLRRDGTGITVSGAFRARISDPLLSVAALDGAARAEAINQIVADLRLSPYEAANVTTNARDARTVAATIRVLRDASADSAVHRYREAATKLSRRERIRIDAFAPAPFASVLAAAGITNLALPFNDALQVARGALDVSEPRAGLIETAGIPVLRPTQDSSSLLGEETVDRARTPMALIHVAAAAHAAGRPAAEIAQLIHRLIASVERNGTLFMALLRWTHRNFVRDPAWRSAPSAYSLAAVWSHADRMLDIAIGGRLEPDALRRALESNEPDVAGIDLLSLQPGPPDVAWPGWMSPAALIHHGLSAIFGSDNPGTVLDEALTERISEAQLSRSDGIVAPEARLLLRRDTWPNVMGAFLIGSPAGYDSGAFDRVATRTLLVDGALDAIRSNPTDAGAWLQLGAFASGGLDQPAFDRLYAIVSADPAGLVRLVAAGIDPRLWRTILQPIAWHNAAEAARLAREVALACRRWHDSHPFDASSPLAPEPAAEELVELAALICACGPGDPSRAFAELIDGFSQDWPALRAVLHQTVGNLTAKTPSSRTDNLWLLQARLASR